MNFIIHGKCSSKTIIFTYLEHVFKGIGLEGKFDSFYLLLTNEVDQTEHKFFESHVKEEWIPLPKYSPFSKILNIFAFHLL